MTRQPIIRAYLGDEVIADNFAGGGGASLGIALALGRGPDVAINHDAEAIAMHAANHPETEHHIESVWKVDPREATHGKPVALAWFSPDCKHHSKAKGGKPREQKIRGLAWVAVSWASRVKPRVIALENVEEFRDWGPLHRKHTNGCIGEPVRERRIGGIARETLGCRPGCRFGHPIANRKGETFRFFIRRLERLGYVVDHRLLRACDYGAPTTRRRLFLIARRDGRPIVWPAPTHAPTSPGGQLEFGQRSLKPYRTAAEVIDWTIPCPSVFDRERPLADKTMARIARGIRKFVIENPRPFVVPVNHGGVGRRDHRVHDINAPMPTITGGQRGGHALVSPIVLPVKTHGGGGNGAATAAAPLRTITASKRGEFAIAVPYLVHRSNGERPGQEPRIYDAQKPLGTIVAQGQKHAACVAFLAKHFGDRPTGGWAGGAAVDRPIDTITARDHHSAVVANLVRYNGDRVGAERVADVADPIGTLDTSRRYGLVASHLVKLRGTSPAHIASSSSSLSEPLPTVSAQGTHAALVAAFLARYNGASTGQVPDSPIGTLDTTDRYALITVTIDGEQYVIVDIGMRMLTPRELFRAQGFHDDYQIAPAGPDGKPLTKTAQIRMCGNSVAPPVAAAIVRANLLDDDAQHTWSAS